MNTYTAEQKQRQDEVLEAQAAQLKTKKAQVIEKVQEIITASKKVTLVNRVPLVICLDQPYHADPERRTLSIDTDGEVIMDCWIKERDSLNKVWKEPRTWSYPVPNLEHVLSERMKYASEDDLEKYLARLGRISFE
jgi:hypothetical protein